MGGNHDWNSDSTGSCESCKRVISVLKTKGGNLMHDIYKQIEELENERLELLESDSEGNDLDVEAELEDLDERLSELQAELDELYSVEDSEQLAWQDRNYERSRI